MTRGMSNFVFVVYHNGLGTLILLPHFIFHRSKRAPLTFSLRLFFLLGLIGSLGQICIYTGIKYSSPTLLAAMGNLIPVFTFLLAVIFGTESLDLRRSSSQAKCLGTVVAVSGALIVTLYKGPSVHMASGPSNISIQLLSLFLKLGLRWCSFCTRWLSGCGMAATVREYPEGMTIVFFHLFFVTMQCAIFSLLVERNPLAWTLRSGIEMLTVVLSAIFGSVFRISILTWCLHKKDPVYVAMFRPMGIVIAVAMGVTFLKDTLHLGSMIGAIIIMLGFYTVMWGQSKEKSNGVSSANLSTQKIPLLQDQI